MLIFRTVLFLLLGSSALCFVFYIATGRMHYRRWGIAILKWTVIAALTFFAVLIVGQSV